MVTFREITDKFQIDGVNMPTPNSYSTDTQIVSTEDSGRLAGNGAMQIDFLTHVFVTTWTYRYMTGDEYDLVYQNYVVSTIKNKNMYHTLKTLNSNGDNSLTYEIYTQDEIKALLQKRTFKPSYYMGKYFENGVRMYKDVTFTFVGVGGEDYESTQSS